MQRRRSNDASPRHQGVRRGSHGAHGPSRRESKVDELVLDATLTPSRASKPSASWEAGENTRMFDLFENKAQVEILHSAADDRLAASMYSDVKKKKKKKKNKKAKKGISGYNFDNLLAKDESSSSNSNYDFSESGY